MNKFEKMEKKMDEWQSGIRVLYKDIQTIFNWTDEQVWKELENEIKELLLRVNMVRMTWLGPEKLLHQKEILLCGKR